MGSSIPGPTPQHIDFAKALLGDEEARDRIRRFAHVDPNGYIQLLEEVGAALRERWERRKGERETAWMDRVHPEQAYWVGLDRNPFLGREF